MTITTRLRARAWWVVHWREMTGYRPVLGKSRIRPYGQANTAKSKRTASCSWDQVTQTASQLSCLQLHYLPHHSCLEKICLEQPKMESESKLTMIRQSGVWWYNLLDPLLMPLNVASEDRWCLHQQPQLSHLPRPTQKPTLLFLPASPSASRITPQCTSLPQVFGCPSTGEVCLFLPQ